MAKTKADLIDEAEGHGLVLTGNETVKQLEAMLAEHDTGDGEGDGDGGDDHDHDGDHDGGAESEAPEAGEHHDALSVNPLSKFKPGTHVVFEGHGDEHVAFPNDPFERRILYQGKNYEHVNDHPVTGCWVYRHFPT